MMKENLVHKSLDEKYYANISFVHVIQFNGIQWINYIFLIITFVDWLFNFFSLTSLRRISSYFVTDFNIWWKLEQSPWWWKASNEKR